MPLLPKNLADEGLSELMRDPRYFDGAHPEHEEYVEFMRAGFEAALDENEAEDSNGGDRETESEVSPDKAAAVEEIQSLDPGTRRAIAATVILGAIEAAGRKGVGPRRGGTPMRLPGIPSGLKEKFNAILDRGKKVLVEQVLPKPPIDEAGMREAAHARTGRLSQSGGPRVASPARGHGIPRTDFQIPPGARVPGAGGRGSLNRMK